MEFATPVVQQQYERITPMMKEVFGEFAVPREDFPAFSISMGSAWIQVAVYPWGDNDAVLRTWAYVVTGVENTPDLMKYLLGENVTLRFGAYGIDNDGDIILQHAIPAAHCDKDELKASVMAILFTADQADDEIVGKFGGQRAIDRSGK